MFDAILIICLVLLGAGLILGNYCKYLKYKIGNEKARDSEWDLDD